MANRSTWDHETRGDGGLPLLLRARQAAQLLGMSKSEFYRLDARGRLPPPVRFGKLKRWSRAVLQRWAEQSCPQRGEERQS